MEDDLLTLIGDERGITNCVILTYNIDFVFLQTLVMRAMKKCGQPKITVFADARCALESYAYQKPFLTGLGSRFRVVPVAMEPGFRFHPKAVFLSSPEKASLFIGSGNLSFGGWRDNAEVWVQFDTASDGTGAVADFRAYLKQVAERLSLPEPILAEIDEAFDPATKAWAAEMAPPTGHVLVGHAGHGPSFIERMHALVGQGPGMRMQVCAPYFDADGEAVRRLSETFSPASLDILLEPGRTNLSAAARSSFPALSSTQAVRYVRSRDDEDDGRNAFIHAKFIACHEEDKVHVFAGSPNCSRAALTIPGMKGNAELAVSLTLPASEFARQFTDRLEFGEYQPPLPDEAQFKVEDVEEPAAIRLYAARFEDGRLNLAFSCAEDVQPFACLADGEQIGLSIAQPGLALADIRTAPSSVRLLGRWAERQIESNALWVDDEHALRTSAPGRMTSEMIRRKSERADFALEDWADVLEALCSDLAYVPSQPFRRMAGAAPQHRKQPEEARYGVDDIFSQSYTLLRSSLAAGDGQPLHLTLPQLLMRWFGSLVDGEAKEMPQAEPGEGDMAPSEGSLKIDIRKNKKTDEVPPAKRRLAEDRRVERIVVLVTQAMTDAAYLRQRQPDLLGRDLRICALLLTTGVRRKFIKQSQFMTATRAIWSAFFFKKMEGRDGKSYRGWVERRVAEDDAPEAFIEKMQSPQLGAALAGWALAIPNGQGPEFAIFSLAYTLSIGRLPWLWIGDNKESLAIELSLMLGHTELPAAANQGGWDAIGLQWLKSLRVGHALYQLEHALEAYSPVELAPQVSQIQVRPGELLWQGKRHRLCIAGAAANRRISEPFEVLTLGGGSTTSFQSHLSVPIAALLNREGLQANTAIADAHKHELGLFIDDLVAKCRAVK
jgi:hypothetical protein